MITEHEPQITSGFSLRPNCIERKRTYLLKPLAPFVKNPLREDPSLPPDEEDASMLYDKTDVDCLDAGSTDAMAKRGNWILAFIGAVGRDGGREEGNVELYKTAGHRRMERQHGPALGSCGDRMIIVVIGIAVGKV